MNGESKCISVMKEFGFSYLGYNTLNDFMLKNVMSNILSDVDINILLTYNTEKFYYFQKDKLHVLIDFKTIGLSFDNRMNSEKSNKSFIRKIEPTNIKDDTFILIKDSRLINVKINPCNGIFLNIVGSVLENSCIRFVENYNKGSRYFIVNSTIKSDLVLSNSSYVEFRQCKIECKTFRIIFPRRLLYFKDINVYSPDNEFIYNSKYARYDKSSAFKINYVSSEDEKVVYIDNSYPDDDKQDKRSELVQFLGRTGYDVVIFNITVKFNNESDSVYLVMKPNMFYGINIYSEFFYTNFDRATSF